MHIAREAVTRALFLPERVWLKSIYHWNRAPFLAFVNGGNTRLRRDFPLTLLPDLTFVPFSLFCPFLPVLLSRSDDKAWINNRLASLFRSQSCFLPSLYYAASADITLHNGVSRVAAVPQLSSSLPLLAQFFFKTCEFVANENKWFLSYFKNLTFSDRVIKRTWRYRIPEHSVISAIFSHFFSIEPKGRWILLSLEFLNMRYSGK